MAFYDLTKTGAQIQDILDNALLKKEQTLTPQEQEQVKTNLGITSGGGMEIPVIVVEGTNVTQELQPNTYYEFGEVTNLTVTFAAEKPNVYNEYMFEFVSGGTATILSLPNDVKWIGDEVPVIESNQKYQISIVNKIGVVGGIATKLLTPLQWTIPLGSPRVFSIDNIDYTASDNKASYNIGSILKFQGIEGSFSIVNRVVLNYKSGESDYIDSSDIIQQVPIAQELRNIQIIINSGGSGN